MTNAAAAKSHAGEHGPGRILDVGAVMQGGERGLRAMAEAQERCILRAARMNREIAGFIDRRLQHDRQTVHALACCRTPQEAASVWGKYIETASRHYAEEMGTLAGLGVDQAQEAAEVAQHEFDETVTPIRADASVK